jgi:hypothetical protein
VTAHDRRASDERHKRRLRDQAGRGEDDPSQYLEDLAVFREASEVLERRRIE